MRLPGFNPTDRGYRIDGPVAAVIGSGEMVVQAATMLRDAGFDVAALHSPDAPLREWARANAIEHYCAEFTAFRSWVETIAVDYLFSVLNFRILPASLIDAPLICSINYHDAPLPKYAGSHATTWALRNGERTHGVSWHVMTELVDAGDLLQQVTFPIPEGATKAWLDQRCYLAAMRAFRTLLPALKAECYTRTPQNLEQRTYYSRDSLGASSR